MNATENQTHEDVFQLVLEKRATGTNWESIATLLSWPVKTLRAWRRENNFDNIIESGSKIALPNDDVIMEVMNEMLLMGYKYKDIAFRLGISEFQLYRWRAKKAYQHPLSLLVGFDLDNIVRTLKTTNRDRGEVMLMACIRDMGYRTTERFLRESLHRVDPNGGII